MKLRNLLPALAMCAPMAAMAVPAFPGLIKQVNPDGKTVEIRLRGDEHFSYATDAAGKYVMPTAMPRASEARPSAAAPGWP